MTVKAEAQNWPTQQRLRDPKWDSYILPLPSSLRDLCGRKDRQIVKAKGELKEPAFSGHKQADARRSSQRLTTTACTALLKPGKMPACRVMPALINHKEMQTKTSRLMKNQSWQENSSWVFVHCWWCVNCEFVRWHLGKRLGINAQRSVCNPCLAVPLLCMCVLTKDTF